MTRRVDELVDLVARLQKRVRLLELQNETRDDFAPIVGVFAVVGCAAIFTLIVWACLQLGAGLLTPVFDGYVRSLR